MLVEWFVGGILGLIGTILSVLPVVTAPTFDISGAVGVIKGLNAGLPMTEALTGVGILLAVASASWVFALARQVWRFVPFIGGG